MARNEGDPAWIRSALDPSVERSAVFVDTSGDPSRYRDSVGPQGVRNGGEAELVAALCLALAESEYVVGVVAPYRAQVAHLRRRLSDTGDEKQRKTCFPAFLSGSFWRLPAKQGPRDKTPNTEFLSLCLCDTGLPRPLSITSRCRSLECN